MISSIRRSREKNNEENLNENIELNRLNLSSDAEIELTKPFYKSFLGDFVPPNWLKLVKSEIYSNVYSCSLLNHLNDIECQRYVSNLHSWIGLLSNDYQIDDIEYIFNPIRYRLFLSQLEINENRSKQSLYKNNLSIETNLDQRLKVLNQLDQLSKQVSHNRSINIVRMWHGSLDDTLPHLLSDGFACLSDKDSGWFGRGIYFTSFPKYASAFIQNSGCLIMSYVIILNPFPIISDDAPINIDPHKFRFYGKGNYKTYQAHYAPVAPIYQNNKYEDNRPPINGIEHAIYDELVVFQQADILPQIVIHLHKNSKT